MKQDKNLWKSIAIAGIWLGVGISAFGCGFGAILIAMFAMVATDSITGS